MRRSPLLRTALSAYRVLDLLVWRTASRADYRSEKVLIPSRRLLYVAVPKAASRSLLCCLLEQEGKNGVGPVRIYETTLEALFRVYPQARDYFTFTVVRNPWSRVVSVYNQKICSDDPVVAARLMNGRSGLFPGMPFEG